MIERHLPILIPLVFFLGALVTAFYRQDNHRLAHATATAVSLAGFSLVLSAAGFILEGGEMRYRFGGWAPPVGIEFRLDALSFFVAVVVAGVAFLALAHSSESARVELKDRGAPFYSAALLFVGGLLGIVLTGDLFNLYVFLEVSSLASYALVAVGEKRAPMAAFRYLLMGSIGASFYLLGLGFLFLKTGTLNMDDMAAILKVTPVSPAIVTGMTLVALGIGLKMALFPLHGWLPDAYTCASSAATALVAPIGTKVAAYVLLRSFFFVFGEGGALQETRTLTVIGYLGAGGIIWGSLMAIAQKDVKRMLAYSSVSQMGYIALGIGLGTLWGFIGAALHLLNHACMKACLFFCTSNFLRTNGGLKVNQFRRSTRLGAPWTSASFLVASLSMVGLPPTAGFFSKWYLAFGSWQSGNYFFLAAILGSSLLSAVYFLRLIERLYFRASEEADGDEALGESERSLGLASLWPIVILAAGLLLLGVGNTWVVRRLVAPAWPGEF